MSRLQALHIQNDAMLTNTFISVQENTKQLCSDECVANDTISSLIILSEKILAQCAFPSGNGQIAPYSEQKCMLSWIRPNYIETWRQMDFVKLLFPFIFSQVMMTSSD
ncbi:hypothetical protein WUBG_03813 [Wuchereria bancrofti]|uniref:Uncharacterized protein n=1 Tax=Wuchereria bancrofti TaxID=6293 RepID=J9ERW3_WUCBA|nr:hypothetical protein WUBG_03813 [Wuchereria bancrofti]